MIRKETSGIRIGESKMGTIIGREEKVKLNVFGKGHKRGRLEDPKAGHRTIIEVVI